MFTEQVLAERNLDDLIASIDKSGERGRQNACVLMREVIKYAAKVLVRLDDDGRPEKTPTPKAADLPPARDEVAIAALRQRCEALADEYSVDDLPETDAGLIEAERRLRALRPRKAALREEYKAAITFDSEKEIWLPTVVEAEVALVNFIREVEPENLVGCAVKLRLLRDPREALYEGDSLASILVVVERQAEREAR